MENLLQSSTYYKTAEHFNSMTHYYPHKIKVLKCINRLTNPDFSLQYQLSPEKGWNLSRLFFSLLTAAIKSVREFLIITSIERETTPSTSETLLNLSNSIIYFTSFENPSIDINFLSNTLLLCAKKNPSTESCSFAHKNICHISFELFREACLTSRRFPTCYINNDPEEKFVHLVKRRSGCQQFKEKMEEEGSDFSFRASEGILRKITKQMESFTDFVLDRASMKCFAIFSDCCSCKYNVVPSCFAITSSMLTLF